MAHPALVDVLNSTDELQEKLASLLFAEPGVPDDVVEKFSAAGIFHDHI